LGEAKQQAEKAAGRPEARGLARWGLVSKGALYVLVGVIAADVAIAGGTRLQDREGALSASADSWPGKLLVAVLAVGLLGYAIWRLIEAVLGRPLEGEEQEGWLKRLGYLARAVWYLGLFGIAIAALAGADESESGKEDRFTARVLEFPLGRWIVGAVGLGILGAGVYNVWRGATGRFRDRLKTREMSELEDTGFTALGVVGHIARGVAVFGLIGFFLVRAAWQYDPEEAIGLDGALAKVLRADYGDTLLAFVAAGLIAYGVYCFAEARYRVV
jgi:Domain of Unknown Function (DUF1206)